MNKNNILAIDLGGTSAKVGIIDFQGKVLFNFIVDNQIDNILQNLFQKIMEKLKEQKISYQELECVGFSTAGFVDHQEGIVKIAGNLNWFDFNLKEEAEKIFQKKVIVLNDANAAALGEFWIGSGKKYKSVLFYTLGTGIGGAIIINGNLVEGQHGYAGEFGHGGDMQHDIDCNCGLKHCIEPTTSAVGLSKAIKLYWKKHPQDSTIKYFKNPQNVEMVDIARVYFENNNPQDLKELIIKIYKPLLNHMALMIKALDPEAILIGGGGSKMGRALLDIISCGLKPLILPIYFKDLKLETAQLGNDAGIIGAAYFAKKIIEGE
ncbi:glucokinase [Spiroplasma sabaudiense Ar-1343]|uniref:Glucokinase n=1 Tax=Spiroplasma sabaudiense Ar-1343 TaxID=1276257 RepID=W6AA28_9MOLU|nr:ROK family protein [Spiroplasma sabaudiense]AHI53912.1 glucokinase [Spiroplasma sabaudiense Ar-1343]